MKINFTKPQFKFFLKLICKIILLVFFVSFLAFGLRMFLDVGETGLFIRVVGVSWKASVVFEGYLYFLLFLGVLFFWYVKYQKTKINKFWLYIFMYIIQYVKFILIIFISSAVGIALFSGAIKFTNLNPYILMVLFGFSFFVLIEEASDKIKSILNNNDK